MTSNFQQIVGWRAQPEEYQKAVYCDEKIWFFGQRFLDQPTYHFEHHVVFGGASSNFFDLKTRQWSQGGSKPFPAVAYEEYLDEITYKHHIFLLLYVHFSKLQLHSLHVFDKEKRVWKKYADFGKIQVPTTTDKNTLILVNGEATYGVFFFSRSNNTYGFNVLEFDGRTAHWKMLDCAMLNDLNSSQLQPTHAAYSKNHEKDQSGLIYIMGGMPDGRGILQWQPNQMIRITFDGANATAQLIPIGDPHSKHTPSFSFGGPFSHGITARGTWLHFAGRKAVGLVGSAFNGDIWALGNFNQIMTASHMGQTITGSFQPPNWTKLALEVPKPRDGSTKAPHILYVQEKNQLFVASPSFGVLAAPMTGW